MTTDSQRAPEDLIGRTLDGRYRVVECIGEGGMGAVYVADHLTLHKQVAVKVIHPEFAGHEAAAQRFAREAMVTSRFQHPNVISAIDFGKLESGGAYLVMELVRGRSLTDILDAEGSIPWARCCDLGGQIADALTAAKGHGIVHRDLKPDNVLVVRSQDGSESVKVLDFGIAKFSRDSMAPPALDGQVTREGMVIGTPGYMAPEQAIGEHTDHRSDLYALGVLLWECIVGRKLFDEDDLTALVRTQLASDPPSVRATAEDLTIPDELDNLVTGLLQRDLAKRPADPAEVRDLLRQLAERGRGSGAFILPETPLAQRLAEMADVAKRREDRTPSGIQQATPMTGEQPAPRTGGGRAALLMAALLALGAGALVYAGQLEVRPRGDLEKVATKLAPQLTRAATQQAPAGARADEAAAPNADAPHGLPRALESQLQALVHAESRRDRVAGAETLLAHMPMAEVPGYVRSLAHFQLEASCDAKKAQLQKLIAHPDPRALPALVQNSQRAKQGCGAAGKDCLGCMRDDLDALIGRLESELLDAEPDLPAP